MLKFFQKKLQKYFVVYQNIVLTTPDGLNLRYSISKATLWEQVKNESNFFDSLEKFARSNACQKFEQLKSFDFDYSRATL